jgi:AraC-like DNA-binding protein
MNYQAFASDLPPERTLTFRSAEESEETMLRMGVNQEMRQLRRGAFRSDLVWRSTETVGLYADRFSTALRVSLEPTPGNIGLLRFSTAGGRLLASGVDVANDNLLFIPKNTTVGLVMPDLTGAETIGISADRFNEMYAAICPDCPPLEDVAIIGGDSAGLNALSSTVLSLLREPGADLHQERFFNLLASTFSWIGESTDRCPTEKLGNPSTHRQIAERAEDFISEHYRDTVLVEDICRETEVGLRSMQRAIRKYFDVTIIELLESVRMTGAYRELSVQNSEERTVTQIALDNGFSHLGRFSVAFHHRYGLKPSEVLAQRPRQKF